MAAPIYKGGLPFFGPGIRTRQNVKASSSATVTLTQSQSGQTGPLYGNCCGGPLLQREDASRFDVSLAWYVWVGARPSLEFLVQWQREGVIASSSSRRVSRPASAWNRRRRSIERSMR